MNSDSFKKMYYCNQKNPPTKCERVFDNLVTCMLRRGLTKHYENKITKIF